MRTINEGYLSPNQVAQELDITVDTLYRWYKWWENDNFKKREELYLPPYYLKDRKRTKFFKKEDLIHLRTFRDAIRGTYKGAMSEFNAVLLWGKRGEKALSNKGMSKEDIRHKL